MFPSNALLSLLLLLLLPLSAVHVSSLPHSKKTLNFAATVNARGVENVVAADKARIRALKHRASTVLTRGVSNIAIQNGGMSYTAEVGIGSPATQYNLIIDLAHGNTWIGALKPYVRTSTSQDTGNTVDLNYDNAKNVFSGEEYLDTVSLGTGLTITGQSIGVATTVFGNFQGADGSLGLGPRDLTLDSTSANNIFTTVTDNLYSQGQISANAIGLFFAPSDAAVAGEISFGGYDSSKALGLVNYVPVTETPPSSIYWGVDQSITYGTTTILSENSGIFDAGTTFISLASDAFSAYKSATGATMDTATGLLTITTEQYDQLHDLVFTIKGVTYSLTPNGQIWPRSLNSVINGTTSGIYLVMTDIGTTSGEGFDFVNGYAFLQRFYSIFDTTNNQIGIALTPYTSATTN